VPFTVTVGEERADGEGVVLKMSRQVDYSIRYCWGVDIPAFHHVLRAPWPWFHQAALHGNIFGSGCMEHGPPSPGLAPHEEMALVARHASPRPLELGPSPRNTYPLVVIAIRGGAGDQVEDRTAVTALLTIVHIRDAVCPVPTQVLGSYLRQGSSVTHLLPLYVSSAPGESSDTESAEDSETEDSEGPLAARARCVVCQLERVTRAALPCRHAITCGSCFERLKSQCPMCRAFINSYFLLCPEPSPRPASPPPPSAPTSVWQRGRQWMEGVNEWVNRGLQEN